MAVEVRRINQGDIQYQGDDVRIVDRYYVATIFTLAAQQDGVPSVGVSHPDIPAAICDALTVEVLGPHSIVTAYYSTDQRFAAIDEPPNVHADGYKSGSASFIEQSVTIPTLVRTSSAILSGDGSSTPTEHWALSKQTFEESWTTETHRINTKLQISSIEQQSALFESVRRQAGKLHVIAGTTYLFRPRLISETADGIWTVEYQWIYDPGTLNPYKDVGLPMASPDWVLVPGSNGWSGWPIVADDDRYTRLPWHSIDTVPYRPDDPTEPPLVIQRPMKVTDSLGWQSLPWFA